MFDSKDNILACSSGALTAVLDIFWVGEFSLVDAHKWGSEKTDNFVLKVAKKQGYKGDDVKGAIKFLADDKNHKNGTKGYHIPSDSNTPDFGGGIQHHLRDFAHHPTPVGLFFSILTQFTEKSYGADAKGNFLVVKVRDNTFIGENIHEKMLYGITYWMFHMVSDMAGSGTLSEGTGIPGPIISLVKELSVLPIFQNVDKDGKKEISVFISKLFRGTMLGERDENGKIIKDGLLRFDLRTELGIGFELSKQAIPVIICEIIVCISYMMRRLISTIKEHDVSSIQDLIRYKNTFIAFCIEDELKRLRTISSVTFSAIDMSSAAVAAFARCDGDKGKFGLELAKRVNYFGVGRLVLSGAGELSVKFDKTFDDYKPIVERLSKESVLVNKDVKEVAEKGASTYAAIVGMGTPIGFIGAAIGVYKEIKTSAEEYQLAKEERIRIVAECDTAVLMLQEYREEMELVVSEYMIERLTVFGEGLDMMDKAIESDDTDSFIQGNNMIQEGLGTKSTFSSQDEFDDLMLSDGDFKL